MSQAFECDRCGRTKTGESNLKLTQEVEWMACRISDTDEVELCNRCISSLQRWFDD